MTGALVALRDADGGPVVTKGRRRGTSGTVAPPCQVGHRVATAGPSVARRQERLGSVCRLQVAKPNQRIQLTGRAILPPRGILLLQRGLQLILGRSATQGGRDTAGE